MKTKELRNLNDKQLLDLLKKLEMETVRASAKWSTKESKMKEFEKKLGSSEGTKTSLQRDIRRTIAKIKTIQWEREFKTEEVKQ